MLSPMPNELKPAADLSNKLSCCATAETRKPYRLYQLCVQSRINERGFGQRLLREVSCTCHFAPHLRWFLFHALELLKYCNILGCKENNNTNDH